jgi:large subunit ribosomal protein L10
MIKKSENPEKIASLGRDCKEIMSKEMRQKIGENRNLFLTTFGKLPVSEVEKLRADLKRQSCNYTIVKKTILKRMLDDLKLAQFPEQTQGPLAIIYGNEELPKISKILVDYARSHETFKICAALVEGSLYDVNGIRTLASIPPREILLAQLAGRIQAPISGLVNYLNGLISKTAMILKAIAEKKQKEGKKTEE